MPLKIELKRGESCYLVRFIGETHMPQNVWLPLPYAPVAPFSRVADDLDRRFAPESIILLRDAGSR